MVPSHFVQGVRPEGFVQVDAARLLLILVRFARPAGEVAHDLLCRPEAEFARHFSSDYYLQKLDFLLRYPRYFAFELIELHAAQDGPARDRGETIEVIRRIVGDREPDFCTEPFERFWRGAYERLDDVEAWWLSRRLVYVRFERRGEATLWKHYFVTQLALQVSAGLCERVEHARWYAQRIEEIHRFMGHLPASAVRARQYRHPAYRDAQLHQLIPDLTPADVSHHFEDVFGEPLGVSLE